MIYNIMFLYVTCKKNTYIDLRMDCVSFVTNFI